MYFDFLVRVCGVGRREGCKRVERRQVVCSKTEASWLFSRAQVLRVLSRRWLKLFPGPTLRARSLGKERRTQEETKSRRGHGTWRNLDWVVCLFSSPLSPCLVQGFRRATPQGRHHHRHPQPPGTSSRPPPHANPSRPSPNSPHLHPPLPCPAAMWHESEADRELATLKRQKLNLDSLLANEQSATIQLGNELKELQIAHREDVHRVRGSLERVGRRLMVLGSSCTRRRIGRSRQRSC